MLLVIYLTNGKYCLQNTGVAKINLQYKIEIVENTHRLSDPLRIEGCFRLTVAHTSKSENKNKHLSFLESPPFCNK